MMALSSAFDHRKKMVTFGISGSGEALPLKGICLTSSLSSEWKRQLSKGISEFRIFMERRMKGRNSQGGQGQVSVHFKIHSQLVA